MVRRIESIQNDIGNVVREMQELRRAQGPDSRSDSTSSGKRIYELARMLDALYAEKRALHAPSAPTASAFQRRRTSRRHRKAAEDLIARLFDGSLGDAVTKRALVSLQREDQPIASDLIVIPVDKDSESTADE